MVSQDLRQHRAYRRITMICVNNELVGKSILYPYNISNRHNQFVGHSVGKMA